MKRIIFITIVIFLLLSGVGWGTVRTVIPGGGGDYTTIAQAEAGATAGDTINVSTGTYNENNPSFTKALTWVAIDGNGSVTITNSGVNTNAAQFVGNTNAISVTGFIFDGGAAKADGIYVANGATNKSLNYCTIQNSTAYGFRAAGTLGTSTIQYCTIGGTLSAAAIYASNPSGLTIDHNTFTVTGVRCLYFDADTGAITITNNTFTCALSNRTINCLGAGTITISGNTGTINGNVTGSNSFISIATAAKNGDVIIQNNNITFGAAIAPVGTSAIGITNGGHAINISGNTFTNQCITQTTGVIQLLNQANPTISNNIISVASTQVAPTAPINVYSTGTNCGTVTVSGNTITSAQTGRQLILIGTDTTSASDNLLDGAVITGNSTYAVLNNTAVHGIEYGYNKNGNISRNYCYGGGYGIVAKGNSENYTTGKITYNILKDCKTDFIRLKGVQNVPIYNNTFYLSDGRTVTDALLYCSINTDSANAPSTGTIIKNNIFRNIALQQAIQIDADSTAGTVINYNNHNVIYSSISGTTYNVWANWQGAGFDGNGIVADPKLASSSNFHLIGGSPCFRTGVNLSLSTDFGGAAVGNPPNIGAYEGCYAGGGLTTGLGLSGGNAPPWVRRP